MSLPEILPESNTRLSRFRRRLGPFRFLTLRQLGWIHFKLALIVWAIFMELFTPKAIFAALQQPILSIWTGVTIFGAAVSVIGLIMSSFPVHSRSHTLGTSVELFGWSLATIGPVVYCTTQFYLLFSNAEKLAPGMVMYTRGALSIYSYAMVAALITRGLILVRLWRRQAKRRGVDD